MKTMINTENKTVNMTSNEIYISKSNKVFARGQRDDLLDVNIVGAVAKNIESLGYTFSEKLFNQIRRFCLDGLTGFYQELIPILRKQVGAHKAFNPMYPNFPAQVMNASDWELYSNAMMHYLGDWFGVRIMPEYEKDERLPLVETVKLKVLDLGDDDDFGAIFTRLVGSNSSISESDKEIVKWFVQNYEDNIVRLIPESIPQKEQLALVASLLIEYTKVADVLTSRVKTATDVLRIAVGLSEGDVSLATPTKFKKFSRSERRFLLNLLNNCDEITEDMLRWSGQWVRLGEVLHPGEYKKAYPIAFTSFDILRNKRPFETFNSKIEKSLKNNEVGEAIRTLRNRPGDFARRLDHIFRLEPNKSFINGSAFLEVANKVSTPVLMQTYNHFKNRDALDMRVFFPKGNTAKMQVDQTTRKPIADNKYFMEAFTNSIRATLIERFSKLESLGKVYLDEKLRSYVVPFSQRSASKTLHTVARGSRIPMPDGDVVRFFLWWKDGDSRTDIDLSGLMYDNGWKNPQHIAYYNLRNATRQCAHSGDITSAPRGACEFIDMNIPSILKDGGRYVMMNLNSYTQQPYIDLPECFAGFMMRTAMRSGEVFEPKTVTNKIDLTANTTIALPVIFDLASREMIWADLSLTARAGYNNNVRNNEDATALMGRAMENMILAKPNLYDLLSMHVEARGELVEREEAEVVFDHETTPYEIDRILSEFLV